MAKVLKPDCDFAKRVENVMQCLVENNVCIEFCAGEFRFSDTKDDAPEYRQNMVLLDIEGEQIHSLPSMLEYKLKVFNT